jgi:hypothetical protein
VPRKSHEAKSGQPKAYKNKVQLVRSSRTTDRTCHGQMLVGQRPVLGTVRYLYMLTSTLNSRGVGMLIQKKDLTFLAG